MANWLICLIAVASTMLCLFLWFRDVRRIMRERKSMVDSAAGQLAISKQKAAAQNDPESTAVLTSSRRIYQQAVDIYNETLCRTWVRLPARLMGYRPIP